MTDHELDVRALRKPDKHPTIFATYAGLGVGESFVLVNNHDPRHLRDEFETEYPGGYEWSYLEPGPTVWRIQITKHTTTALPRVLANTAALASAAEPDANGAIWNLPVRQRDLDANVIRLLPGGSIAEHAGPDIDVLIHVIDGTGHLITERGRLELSLGDVVWLPQHSRRQFTAGAEGIRYLTVHRRRHGLVLEPATRASSSTAGGVGV
ncbi:hypothetical protein C6I20_03130 [Aeromicrobium sp. A1-2]|uniref:DUF2249 domain-containing protein n=1 Tax=Aeromicrobium sp. A1-2 TaxID=2107713 RepID=UPI000E4CFC57|nr:DUF2249 domain-containing protein [Aeromicrobium sp. A1-2]AXT84285.1 hypothetical protein C6I20_03130 [Aeromicrobium sp. A1-2]